MLPARPSPCPFIFPCDSLSTVPAVKPDRHHHVARFEDGRLFYDNQWYCRGQAICINRKDEYPARCVSSSLVIARVMMLNDVICLWSHGGFICNGNDLNKERHCEAEWLWFSCAVHHPDRMLREQRVCIDVFISHHPPSEWWHQSCYFLNCTKKVFTLAWGVFCLYRKESKCAKRDMETPLLKLCGRCPACELQR